MGKEVKKEKEKENMKLKNADIKIGLASDSGYNATIKARISPYQWQQILLIIEK